MQWLYVGAVAAGLGAGIATGQGVAAATEVEPLVDTLSAMLLGIGFYAGYIGTPRRVRAITTEIQQRLTGMLGIAPPGAQ